MTWNTNLDSVKRDGVEPSVKIAKKNKRIF